MKACALGLALGLIVASACPATVLAQLASDQDTAEISAYELSVSGLAKYRQANTNLVQLGEALAQICDEDADDQSIDGMVAQMRGVPGAAEAIESAGLPLREYVVLTWAMIQAGFAAWGLDQPGGELPPGVSMANVEFFRAHEAEFQEAANQVKPYDCDDNGDDGYDEEAPDENDYEE